jgi:hypothetical protein
MDGPVATLSVTSGGLHTVNVWVRESGFRLDRLLLTSDAQLTPSGNGPPESDRAAGVAPGLTSGGGPTGTMTEAQSITVGLALVLVASLLVLASGARQPIGVRMRQLRVSWLPGR